MATPSLKHNTIQCNTKNNMKRSRQNLRNTKSWWIHRDEQSWLVETCLSVECYSSQVLWRNKSKNKNVDNFYLIICMSSMKSQLDRLYSEKKLPPSWCHWRKDEGSEMSRKKENTAPRWFERQKKILGELKEEAKDRKGWRRQFIYRTKVSFISPWTC